MLLCLDVIVVYAVVVIVFYVAVSLLLSLVFMLLFREHQMVCEFLMMEVELGLWGGVGRVQWGHLCKTYHTKIIQF